ncbi:MAG TPA: hypothetical protein VGK93_03430 [Candidatus Eisenbacteria bacterium]
MKRTLTFAATILLALAALAEAQTQANSSQTTGDATTNVQTTPGNASTNAAATAEANADAQAAFQKTKEDIRNKGAKVSADVRAKAEAKLTASATVVDNEATKGEETVASRLAAEFGMTGEALAAEKTQLGTSWGQLMIAHTLMANATTQLTCQQLLDMRSDMGWGQIAAGLGLKLGDAVSAVSSEGRVASGRVRADGKVAVIHGEGAKAGLATGARTSVGIKTQGKDVAPGLGVK